MQFILVGYVLHLAKQMKYHQVLQLDLCHIMVCLTSGLLLGYVVSLFIILSRQDRLFHQGLPILEMLTGDWVYCYGAFWTAQQYQKAAFWTAEQNQSLYKPIDEAAKRRTMTLLYRFVVELGLDDLCSLP
jgi:hypothetical protein